MADTAEFERIVAVDINRSITNACLFARVDGQFRLVAHGSSTTTLAGDRGVVPGVLYAIQRLEHIAQVHLLGVGQNTLNLGKPHTALLVSCSLAGPLRVQPLGLSATFSAARVTHACQLPFIDVLDPILIDGWLNQAQDQQSMLTRAPDVVILSGGFEDTSPSILEAVAHSLVSQSNNVARAARPVVICAGSQAELRVLTRMLSNTFNLRGVKNISPAPAIEQPGELQQELLEIYEQTKLVKIPGYDELLSMCSFPILSTFHALENAANFIADPFYSKRLLVDAAQDTTGFYRGSGENIELYGNRLGFGHSDDSAEKIKRWLPLGIADSEAVVDFIQSGNGSLSSPESNRLANFAAAHQGLLESIRLQAISSNRRNSVPGDIDFLAYHEEQTIYPADNEQMLLTILDTIQPTGATRVELDRYYFWPHLGVIGFYFPQAAAEINTDMSFHTFGICLAPHGSGGSKATVKVKVTRADGTQERHAIPGGIIKVIRFPSQEMVGLDAYCSAEFYFYDHQRRIRLAALFGSLGLIVDTRGRPLPVENAGMFWRLRVGSDLSALTKG
ncbi:MAG: glutamate mutase L [Anaerolineae bacterium]